MAEPSILGALRDPQFRSDTLRNLVEALNGAKRSLTVGSLGAVGDMGSTLANLVRAGAGTAYHETTGRPIPQALEYRDPARDFGTSASLGNFAERQGWLPPQTYSMPEQAGALLGPIAAMKAPDLAQSTLRGLVSALKSEPSRRMVEGYMGGMGMKPQAIVWHGSPHTFDAFDSSKIGTGEGAQAYGHGLYLAETPDVATRYRDTLTNFRPDHIEAKLIESGISPEFANTYAQFAAQTKGGARGFDDFAELMAKPGPSPYIEQFRQRIRAEMPAARTAGDAIAGSLYKVDLPDPLIARMLDWDKPLSQQAPEVRGLLRKQGVSGKEWDVQAIGNGPQGNLNDRFVFDSATEARKKLTELRAQGYYARPFGDAFSANKTGADFVKNMSDPAIQAERLRAMGIPGIRYLDGGSRADGAGTSNFVIFPKEEGALTILERNGKPVRNNVTPQPKSLTMSNVDLSRIPGAAEADNAVREIERLAEQHGTVYIRWSAGTGHDLKPGANSRDSVSGASHAGLSAIPISGDMHPVDIAKRLAEYGFLRMKDKGIRPRVYVGEQIGTDSDGYALIRPSSEVAKVSDETVRAIDSGYAKAAELRDRIDELSARLPKLQGSGRDITERNLAKAREELNQLLSSVKK